jgi:hypothetical protein
MPDERKPEQAAWPHRAPPASAGDKLATVVYRSRAVSDMTPPALTDLTRASQARNGREGLTGVLLYDSGAFYQWLEGPREGVDRVMRSIHHDARHTNVDVLNNQTVQARAFGGWSMKLAAQGRGAAEWPQDVIEAPPEVVETLRARPEAAPDVLVKLQRDEAAPSHAAVGGKLNPNVAAMLRQVLLAKVLPALFGAEDTQIVVGGAGAGRAAELADLLIGADQEAAMSLIRELHGAVGTTARLFATLLEPAARSLGDLWSDDLCSEFDLTLGLARLQTAVHMMAADPLRVVPGRLQQPAVLIVPEPGELHRLGAALDNTILGNAGWAPQFEYPRDDETLQEMLAESWFDVLDLSLSVALRQEQWLPRLRQTIAQARRASRNPGLTVVVGGRVFRESARAGANVGADITSRSSSNVDRSILRNRNVTRSETASETLTAQPTPS